VKIGTVDELIPAFEQRIAERFLYGDFQFSIEHGSDEFLRKGVLSCYHLRPSQTRGPRW